MREIVLDTETTGMDPEDGHRIIEIGCVELFNHLPTGRTYHQYINPEREVEAGAIAVHGIKNEFLADKPVFAEIVGEFMDFIGDGTMVIHNAEFDIKFINAEIKPFGYKPYKLTEVIDTLLMARKKFPGSPANLDALCRRFNVDLSARELHGALLDAQLLADVYLELQGGRQHGLGLSGDEKKHSSSQENIQGDVRMNIPKSRPYREPREFVPSAEELEAHAKMVSGLKDSIW
ncbi:MAG: DNA polymerase III subunit epsilon [Alphaproteobacteria bacterium]|nr:DNA polymerase III subunit epsilon [Alphaproteobacteria bacterium]